VGLIEQKLKQTDHRISGGARFDYLSLLVHLPPA
jgi:hypothetical protein